MKDLMQNIDVFIWYDRAGKITAVGTPHSAAVGRVEARPSAERDVLHVTMEDMNGANLKSLHRTHCVDVARRALVSLQKP
jgi:hypothetical protein